MDLFDSPHHDGSPRYVGTSSPRLGDDVAVRIRVPRPSEADQVHVRTIVDGEPCWLRARRTGRDEQADWWEAMVPMVRPSMHYRFLLSGGRAGYQWLNATGSWCREVPDREDFVVATTASVPGWVPGTVAYQIFIDRFARSRPMTDPPAWAIPAEWDDPIAAKPADSVRQLYGGDLDGIREHLDHLDALGVDLVYLTPFFPASSSHRYDADSFDRVDPLLGGDQALRGLVGEAHRRGIRVIGDLTTNHCGSGHDWFTTARHDATSAEAGFFLFEHHPDHYASWHGVRSLPKLDHTSEELRERLIRGEGSVVARWLAGPDGLDGWRIDVANMTGRHGTVDVNHDVAHDIRVAMEAVRPDAWLVAEHCHDAAVDLQGGGWHGTMAYAWFTRPVWSWLQGPEPAVLPGNPVPVPRVSGAELVAALRSLSAGVPWSALLASLILLDSHDTARFADVAQSKERHLVGVALLLTYLGVPMVFAGDEVGVRGADADQGRQPFPWDASRWDHELLDGFRSLVHLRRSAPALQVGGLRWLAAHDDSVTFIRESADEAVLVHLVRAPCAPTVLDAGACELAGPAVTELGGHDLDITGGLAALPGDGPAAYIWRIGR